MVAAALALGQFRQRGAAVVRRGSGAGRAVMFFPLPATGSAIVTGSRIVAASCLAMGIARHGGR